jgi:hypothetical protein
MITGKVLDSTAVLDIANQDSIYGQALLTVSNRLTHVLAVPMVTLSAAWAHSAHNPSRLWLDLLVDEDAEPAVVVIPVDAARAKSAGVLAADAGQPDAPLGTVHAAHLALERSWPVVTRDPDAVLALSSGVRTETIP